MRRRSAPAPQIISIVSCNVFVVTSIHTHSMFFANRISDHVICPLTAPRGFAHAVKNNGGDNVSEK